MTKSKFSEEQIAYVLRQVEAGSPVADICRQVGVSEATFYIWKKKYAHLGLNELRQIRQLEDENGRLKRLVADLSPDKHILAEAPRKKSETHTAPRAGRLGPCDLRYQLRACGPAIWRKFSAAWYRRSHAKDQSALRLRIRELAPARPRFGLSAHLGVAATRRLAGEDEARASAVSPGRLAAQDARPATQTYRPASRTGARADRSDGAPEHGLCARCVGGWSPVSGPDRGRSVDSPESDPKSGLQPLRRETVGIALDRVLSNAVPRSITVDHGTEFMSRARRLGV
jgi:transposase-like protein